MRWQRLALPLAIAVLLAGGLLGVYHLAGSRATQQPSGNAVSRMDTPERAAACPFAVYLQPEDRPFVSFPRITEELLGRTPVADLPHLPPGAALWFEPLGANAEACLRDTNAPRGSRLLLRHHLTGSALAAVADIPGLEGLALGPQVPLDALAAMRSKPTLRELTLDEAPSLAVLQGLRGLSHLETLSLTLPDRPKHSAALADTLGSLPALRRLQLGGWNPLDGELRQILRGRQIEMLSLDATRLTASGVASLGGLGTLRLLDMSWGLQGPTPATVRALRGLRSVQRLYLHLGAQPEDDTTAGACLATLGGLQSLRELVVTGGVGIRVFGPRDLLPLKRLSQLRTLGLEGYHLNAEALSEIGQLRSLEVLRLSGGWTGGPGNVFGDSGVRHLANLQQLRVLDISNSPVGDAAGATLGGLPLLERLVLRDTSVTDKGVAQLKNMTRLTALSLPAGASNDAALQHIAQHCPALRELDLQRTFSDDQGTVTATGLAHLARLGQLKHLTLHKSDDDDAAELARLRTLESLGLYDSAAITDKGLGMLATLPKLHTLRMSNTFGSLQITPNGLEALGGSSSLVRLEMDGVAGASEELENRLRDALALADVSVRPSSYDEMRDAFARMRITPDKPRPAPTPGGGAASEPPRP